VAAAAGRDSLALQLPVMVVLVVAVPDPRMGVGLTALMILGGEGEDLEVVMLFKEGMVVPVL